MIRKTRRATNKNKEAPMNIYFKIEQNDQGSERNRSAPEATNVDVTTGKKTNELSKKTDLSEKHLETAGKAVQMLLKNFEPPEEKQDKPIILDEVALEISFSIEVSSGDALSLIICKGKAQGGFQARAVWRRRK